MGFRAPRGTSFTRSSCVHGGALPRRLEIRVRPLVGSGKRLRFAAPRQPPRPDPGVLPEVSVGGRGEGVPRSRRTRCPLRGPGRPPPSRCRTCPHSARHARSGRPRRRRRPTGRARGARSGSRRRCTRWARRGGSCPSTVPPGARTTPYPARRARTRGAYMHAQGGRVRVVVADVRVREHRAPGQHGLDLADPRRLVFPVPVHADRRPAGPLDPQPRLLVRPTERPELAGNGLEVPGEPVKRAPQGHPPAEVDADPCLEQRVVRVVAPRTLPRRLRGRRRPEVVARAPVPPPVGAHPRRGERRHEPDRRPAEPGHHGQLRPRQAVPDPVEGHLQGPRPAPLRLRYLALRTFPRPPLDRFHAGKGGRDPHPPRTAGSLGEGAGVFPEVLVDRPDGRDHVQ